MVHDVPRAYVHAEVTRVLYSELPAEDKDASEGDMVGTLQWCGCDTRDAPRTGGDTAVGHMASIGCVRRVGHPSSFHNPSKHICSIIHGGDYTSSGDGAALQWFRGGLATTFEIQTKWIGHAGHLPREGSIINRAIRDVPTRLELDRGPKHSGQVLETLRLQYAMGVVSPGVGDKYDGESGLFHETEATLFRYSRRA